MVKRKPTSGFDFKFTSADKVKAVVARKRPTKPISAAKKPDGVKVVENNKKSETIVNESRSVKSPSPVPATEAPGSDDTDGIQIGISFDPVPMKPKKPRKEPIKKQKKFAEKKKEDESFIPLETTSFDSDDNEDASNAKNNDDDGIQIGISYQSAERKPKFTSQIEFSDNSGVKVFPDKVKECSGFIPIDPHNKPRSSETGDNKNKKNKLKRKAIDEISAEMPDVADRRVIPIRETVFTGVKMDTIGLHPHLVKNCGDVLKITELTTIQQRAVPKILEQIDVLVRSQTGSGKTLAFALPLVQMLQAVRPKISRDAGIQAVIVCPTRELVIQIYDLFVKLLRPFTWIVVGYLCGGEKRKSEKARLRKGINIMVGTPGRLCDHLTHTESFKLDQVRWLILDEADRLLELGYEKDVGKIVDSLSGNEVARQTMLLSATLTPAVEKLAGLTLKNPQFIDNADSERTENFEEAVKEAISGEKLVVPTTIRQTYLVLPPKLRLATLSGLLVAENRRNGTKILVFMATQDLVDFHHDAMVEVLTKKVLDEDDEAGGNEMEHEPQEGDEVDDEDLNEEVEEDDGKAKKQTRKGYSNKKDDCCYLKGVRFFRLHGSMTQVERKNVFAEFSKSKSGVLLSTDVAARGLDVPEVDVVVQYTPPQKLSDYVHRIGRTARAGRNGKAIIFLNPTEIDFVHLLNDKGLKLWQEEFKRYLRPLIVNPKRPNAADEYVSDLQHKYEELIMGDQEIKEKAYKAFVSWVRFYSAFPKDMRAIFNRKQVHMGHYAKSLGLREPPSSFSHKFSAPRPERPSNRLTYAHKNDNRDDDNQYRGGHREEAVYGNQNKGFGRFLANNKTLNTSEFGSGISASKKKRFDD